MASRAVKPERGSTRLQELPSWMISRVASRSHRLLTEGFATVGLRGHHYRLLAALEEFGPSSQADLGRRADIDRSDVVATVNELAAQALVVRNPDPGDRRRNIISLTPAGTRQLRRLDRTLAGVQERVLEPLSPAERAQLMRLLRRLVDDEG